VIVARHLRPPAMALAAIVVVLLAAACGGGAHHVGKTTATPRAKTAPPTEASVSRAFATAYLAYIDGRRKVSSLPDSTAAVRAAARTGGTIPHDKRAGQLVLVALKPAAGVKRGVLLTGRNLAGTLYAQETLSHTGQGWRVTGLMTPDFVQVFVKQSTATTPQPTGSVSAEQSARTFLTGYLPYYYGHAPATNVRGDTPVLGRFLRAHPTNVPPAMQSLQGQVAGIAMTRSGAGWRALVNVHDARSTYQLTLTLTQVGARWVVTGVSAQ
jgi:hypothetical protein